MSLPSDLPFLHLSLPSDLPFLHSCSVLGNYTACLQLAAIGPKTHFKIFRYTTEPAANSTNASSR